MGNETYLEFENILSSFKDCVIRDFVINGDIIGISYEINGEEKQMFLTHHFLCASCKYWMDKYFKNHLGS
jgi:hypothetical protein